MIASDLATTSLASISSHPLRSTLTALGAVIGVAAVVILLGLGVAAQRQVAAAIEAMGSNLISVNSAFRPTADGGLGFSLRDSDVEALRERLRHDGISASVQTLEQFSAGGNDSAARLTGIDADYFRVRNAEIAQGRPLDSDDLARRRRVAVIGSSVAAALFPGGDPIGGDLEVGRNRYEVIGTLRTRGVTPSGDDPDNIVLVPINLARLRIGGGMRGGNSVQQIYVKATSEETVEDTQAEILEILRERHRLRPGETDDFQVGKATATLDASRSASQTFTILLALLGAVSLGVGGIGIMNIMLVSVAERRREIGLRMAVGASRRDITLQFLCEAIALSIAGGVVGIVVGTLGIVIARMSGWDAAIPFWIPISALTISVFVGAAFGTYPAWKAGRLYPMESLRGT